MQEQEAELKQLEKDFRGVRAARSEIQTRQRPEDNFDALQDQTLALTARCEAA